MKNNWLEDLGLYLQSLGLKNVFVGFKPENPKEVINNYILIMPESGVISAFNPFRAELFWIIVSHPNKKICWDKANKIMNNLHNKTGKLGGVTNSNVFKLINCTIPPQPLGTDSRGITEYHTKYRVCFNDYNLNNNLH